MDLNNKMNKPNILASALAVLLCLSLTACGSKKNSVPPGLTCTGGQALNAGQTACMECSTGEFPDIDRTACVSSCPPGQLKPDNAETCVMMMVCADGLVFNPGNNTCIELSCETFEIADTTATPPECIATAACRSATGKVVNTTDDACIAQSACIGVASQIASDTGNCEVCANPKPVRHTDLNACIAAATCTAVAGQANVNNTCTACSGSTPLVSLDKTMCIDNATCTTGGNVANRAGNACVPPPDMDSDTVADGDDNCPNVANTLQTDTDSDEVGDACDACPTGATGMATTSGDSAATADPDGDGCKNSEDTDDDNDGVVDTSDAFPQNDCASVDTDGDDDPDRIVAGCTGATLTEDTDDDNDSEADATDVDDDNDGLIEIASAAELNNMRHDLAGKSYDDEADDGGGNEGDTSGAPTSATTLCPDETSVGSGIYLCGYELVADIDFAGPDGDPSTAADNLDENSTTAGNFDPIAGNFTALLEGNGHTISNLAIDITGTARADNDANNAALIVNCRGRIRNITLANAQITGRRHVAALCATMNGASVNNAHISGAIMRNNTNNVIISFRRSGSIVGSMGGSSAVSNSSASTAVLSSFIGVNSVTGGLIGLMGGSSAVSNSYATGNVSNEVSAGGNSNVLNIGGLIGRMNDSNAISNSYATGNCTTTANNIVNTQNIVGSLIGWIFGSSVSLSNSYATGAITSSGSVTVSLGGLGGSEGLASPTYANNYWNSEAAQTINDTARGSSDRRGVGSQTTDPSGVTPQTLAQILALTATTLKWNATLHWSFTAGEHPKLRYADNPHTTTIDECDYLQGVSCGDLLPGQ